MMRILLWAIVLGLLLAIATTAAAQQATLPETLAPTNNAAQGGLLLFDPGVNQSLAGMPVKSHDEFSTSVAGELSLQRTVDMQRQDLFGHSQGGLPFGYLYNQKSITTMSFGLGARGKFNYQSTRNQKLSVTEANQGYNAYEGFGLQQGLGGGGSNFTLGFKQGTREVQASADAPVNTYREQSMSLAGTAGEIGKLSLGFSSSTPDSQALTATKGLQFGLAHGFKAGQMQLGWQRTQTSTGSVEGATTKTDLVLPVAITGGAMKMAYHSDMTAAGGGPATGRESTALALPLDMLLKGGKFAWSQSTQLNAGVPLTDRNLAYNLPLEFLTKGASYSYKDTQKTNNGLVVAGNTNEKFVLPMGWLHGGANFGYVNTEKVTNGVTVAANKAATFMTPLGFLDKGSKVSWSNVKHASNGAWTDTTTYAVSSPLNFLTKGTTLAWDRQVLTATGLNRDRSTLKLSAPLYKVIKGGSMSWQMIDQNQNGTNMAQRTLAMAAPLTLLGRETRWNFTNEDTSVEGADTHRQAWVWGVPFEKKNVTLAYTHITPISASGEAQPAQTIQVLKVPQLPVLTKKVQAAFSTTKTMTDGSATVTHNQWTTTVEPADKLKVASQVQETNSGNDDVARTTAVHADYSVHPNLSLNWRYLENQQVGVGPAVSRYVGVDQKLKSPVPMQMKVGYTTYGLPTGQSLNSGLTAQVAAGNQKTTALTLNWQGFNENTLAKLPEKTVGLALTHHMGDGLGVRVEYQNQPGRAAPLKGVSLAGPMLGGTVTLSHIDNPPDPRNASVVRLAEQWDVDMARKLGALDMSLKYRRCDFDDQSDAQNYMGLSVAGGKPEAGGQLKLSYLSGDFVPGAAGQVLPDSTLQLSYSKTWSSNAELTLMVQHESALPASTSTTESQTEGRLELKAQF